MKPAKMTALAKAIGNLIDESIEFGKAIQRHDDAHDEMMFRQEDVQKAANGVQELLLAKTEASKLN